MKSNLSDEISDELDFYLEIASNAGCTYDQWDNFNRAGILLEPKQLEVCAAARLCDVKGGPFEVGMGGARGGGKSFVSLAQLGADDCQRFAGLKCLLLRKVGASARESLADLRKHVLLGLPHEYSSHAGLLTFPNGSSIIVGHFQSENDIDRYLGIEYDVIAIEEATTLTEAKYKDIKTCLRTSKAGWRPRVYLTTNPGGIGHTWFKKRFILPHREQKEITTRFVPMTVDDNPNINPEYKKNVLETLTGWKRKAWLYGDWNVLAGQFFSVFSEIDHINSPNVSALQDGNLKPWTFWASFDYGWTHLTVSHLLARDGDGNVYVLDEYSKNKRMPEIHVKKIRMMWNRNGLEAHNIESIQAGTDCWSKDRHGMTIEKEYKSLGMKFTAANTDRINGAAYILKLLSDPRDPDITERPKLFINARCSRLIECLSDLQHNPKQPEDVLKIDCDEDGEGGDDAYDSLRYGVMRNFQKGKAGHSKHNL